MMIRLLGIAGFLTGSLFSQAAVTVLNGLSHHFTVRPGEKYSGMIIIGNTDPQTALARLTLFDYQTTAGGETIFGEAGKLDRSNASWIYLAENQVRVNTGEQYLIPFEIRVPANPGKAGTYWCVVMVEPAVEPDTAAVRKGSIRIQNKVRYAVQILCHLEESGLVDLKFLGAELVKEEGIRYVDIDLENTGERYVRPVVQLDFFDREGREWGSFKSIDQGLYPGSSLRFRIEIDAAIPGGEYKVVGLASCSPDQVFGVNLTLHIRDD